MVRCSREEKSGYIYARLGIGEASFCGYKHYTNENSGYHCVSSKKDIADPDEVA